MITEKEIKNAEKVLDLLSQIDDVSFMQNENRPDLITVTEGDSGFELLIDVEEDIVMCIMSITELEGDISPELAVDLLRANNSAVHGAFSLADNRLMFKSNLEIANLDLNELEASIVSTFMNVDKILPVISKALKGE